MEKYIEGNTVRKDDLLREDYRRREERRLIKLENERHANAKRASIGNLIFMVLAVAATCAILVSYITIQATVRSSVKNIAELESTLNTMKQDNDEAYNKANSSLDLEEIKRIAIQEYGMTYASEGQIITYSDEGGNDYVRQIAPIPSDGE
ncbi:MAG: cell division protein FtsL [Butyrivibrio sp.]|nr:cell division protein FtsL [Butyrivibrio sp.]